MSPTAPQLPGADSVARAFAEYGLPQEPKMIDQTLSYLRLLLTWNEKFNLTAIRDPVEILHRHFCESMYAAVSVPIERGRLADVGSGGGFPGLPLKIIQPELEVFLIESNVKKATFLAEVIRELSLQDVRVIVSRYEDLGEEIAPLDFVCARAVGDFEQFLTWAGAISTSARGVVLWIGGRDIERVKRYKSWIWREPIPMPYSLQRYLLVGERNS
jgi:16S rRNA (guanine527-N7)-methyltransferase